MKIEIAFMDRDWKKEVFDDLSSGEFSKKIHEFDWNENISIWISRDEKNWLECNGCYDEFNGCFEENRQSYGASKPLRNLQELELILSDYLTGGEDWKKLHK